LYLMKLIPVMVERKKRSFEMPASVG
jgi:hypothetical protein